MLQVDYWGFYLGVAGWITTLIFGVLHYKQAYKKKILTYKILPDTPVISVHKDIAKQIQVSYGDIRVTQLRLIEIHLKNSGTEVIHENDFHTPITFSTVKNCKQGKPEVFWDKMSILPENMKGELKSLSQ
jgi:hypothetical protein